MLDPGITVFLFFLGTSVGPVVAAIVIAVICASFMLLFVCAALYALKEWFDINGKHNPVEILSVV